MNLEKKRWVIALGVCLLLVLSGLAACLSQGGRNALNSVGCGLGFASACNALGLSLAVQGKPDEAGEYYQKACDSGDMEGCCNQGLLANHEGNGKSAESLLTVACDGGSDRACRVLSDWEREALKERLAKLEAEKRHVAAPGEETVGNIDRELPSDTAAPSEPAAANIGINDHLSGECKEFSDGDSLCCEQGSTLRSDFSADGSQAWCERDGRKHGKDLSWYNSGAKATEADFRDGELHGLFVVWHENGRKGMEYEYRHDKKDGAFTEWAENGQKRSEGTYRNDKVHGVVTEWHEDGRRKAVKTFSDGKLVSAEVSQPEAPNVSVPVEPPSSCPEGAVLKGKPPPHGRELWCEKSGDKHGPYIRWHENGRLAERTEYQKGKLHGLQTSWFPAGGKSTENEYKEGLSHGNVMMWDQHGRKEMERTDRNGKPHGVMTLWYSNGKKQFECEYRDGVEYGRTTSWDENGRVLDY